MKYEQKLQSNNKSLMAKIETVEEQIKQNKFKSTETSFINTSTKSLFINTVKDQQVKSVRSKSRKGSKPITKSTARNVETPTCSLQKGMLGVDALLICELEQKINEMTESLKSIKSELSEQITTQVDKLGEDIAIDINQIEASLKKIDDRVDRTKLEKYESKEKKQQQVGTFSEDLVKNIVRGQLKDVKY